MQPPESSALPCVPFPTDVRQRDHFLQLRLESFLRRDPQFLGRSIGCVCHEGVVILKGEVNSFSQKQMAQELVRGIEGVKLIVNSLVVGRSEITRMLSEVLPFGTRSRYSADNVE